MILENILFVPVIELLTFGTAPTLNSFETNSTNIGCNTKLSRPMGTHRNREGKLHTY